MKEMNADYTSVEARKLIAEYIDESAIRLAQRLRKVYSEEKKQATEERLYA